MVKVTVFITTMENYVAVNNVYNRFFKDPKPVSLWTCERAMILLGKYPDLKYGSVALVLQ